MAKLKRIEEKDINPYPAFSNRTHTSQEALENFDKLSGQEQEIYLAGRIRSIRGHGSSTFCHIEDGGGKIQIYIKKDEIGEEDYSFL